MIFLARQYESKGRDLKYRFGGLVTNKRGAWDKEAIDKQQAELRKVLESDIEDSKRIEHYMSLFNDLKKEFGLE